MPPFSQGDIKQSSSFVLQVGPIQPVLQTHTKSSSPPPKVKHRSVFSGSQAFSESQGSFSKKIMEKEGENVEKTLVCDEKIVIACLVTFILTFMISSACFMTFSKFFRIGRKEKQRTPSFDNFEMVRAGICQTESNLLKNDTPRVPRPKLSLKLLPSGVEKSSTYTNYQTNSPITPYIKGTMNTVNRSLSLSPNSNNKIGQSPKPPEITEMFTFPPSNNNFIYKK